MDTGEDSAGDSDDDRSSRKSRSDDSSSNSGGSDNDSDHSDMDAEVGVYASLLYIGHHTWPVRLKEQTYPYCSLILYSWNDSKLPRYSSCIRNEPLWMVPSAGCIKLHG